MKRQSRGAVSSRAWYIPPSLTRWPFDGIWCYCFRWSKKYYWTIFCSRRSRKPREEQGIRTAQDSPWSGGLKLCLLAKLCKVACCAKCKQKLKAEVKRSVKSTATGFLLIQRFCSVPAAASTLVAEDGRGRVSPVQSGYSSRPEVQECSNRLHRDVLCALWPFSCQDGV